MLTFEQRKAETLECAAWVRKTLKDRGIPARVYIVWYKRDSPVNLLCVNLKGKEYEALSHWQRACMQQGVKYWLNTWENTSERYKNSTKIICS